MDGCCVSTRTHILTQQATSTTNSTRRNGSGQRGKATCHTALSHCVVTPPCRCVFELSSSLASSPTRQQTIRTINNQPPTADVRLFVRVRSFAFSNPFVHPSIHSSIHASIRSSARWFVRSLVRSFCVRNSEDSERRNEGTNETAKPKSQKSKVKSQSKKAAQKQTRFKNYTVKNDTFM